MSAATAKTLPTSPLPEDAIGATKAAQLLLCNVCVIHRWVDAGKLPGWRVGAGPHRRLWVSLADVMAMCQRVEPKNSKPRPHAQVERRRAKEATIKGLARLGLTPDGEKIPRAKE